MKKNVLKWKKWTKFKEKGQKWTQAIKIWTKMVANDQNTNKIGRKWSKYIQNWAQVNEIWREVNEKWIEMTEKLTKNQRKMTKKWKMIEESRKRLKKLKKLKKVETNRKRIKILNLQLLHSSAGVQRSFIQKMNKLRWFSKLSVSIPDTIVFSWNLDLL